MLAFADLNLRFNPFGELPAEERALLAVVEIDELAEALESPRTAVQFVAQHGRGKTTHLLALRARFPNAAYRKLEAGAANELPRAELLFVDSIDVLDPAARRRCYRSIGRLAFTTHQDLTAEVEEAGFDVKSRSVRAADASLLAEIFRRRIEHARRGPGPLPVVDRATIDDLQRKFGDDVRAMEESLYWKFQTLTESSRV